MLLEVISRQDKILNILVTIILILYRKLYLNIVSIIVLNIDKDNALSRLILLYRAALIYLISFRSSRLIKRY